MSTSLKYLGKYELQQSLGKGNVGEVWKGYDTQHHRDVAIKILHTDLQSDPHFLTRFTTDGQEMTSLHHSNIVQVHEVNVSRSAQSNEILAYLTMDYIEGITLHDYLQQTAHKGTFPSVTQLVYLFTSLGVAIDYAHQKGIVHGNIKPRNIILNKRNTSQFTAGEPMLTDCGLTQFLNSNSSSLVSPHYMSPEQARGEAPNNRSDIYALGVILYEICTGVQPFRDESSVAVMMQHINTLPTPPILINPNIPPALSEVILRAMAKDTATRFPMASLLAAAISDACSTQKDIRISLGNPATFREEQETSTSTSGPLPTSILGVAQPPATPQPRITSKPLPSESKQPAASQTNSLPTVPTPIISGQLPRVTSPLSLQTNKLPSITPTGKVPTPSLLSTPSQPLPPLIHQVSPSFSQPLPQVHPPARLPAPTPSQTTASHEVVRRRRRFIDEPVYVVTAALVLVLLVIGSAIGTLLAIKSGAPSQPTVKVPMGNVYFQDDALGHNDTLHIQLQNAAAPPAGKSYVAWLQDTHGNTTLLGQLAAPQNDSLSFTYPGDAQHSNLLLNTQSIFITYEDTDSHPSSPTGNKIYQATLDTPSFPHIKDILAVTPELPANQSVIVTLFESIKSINDKANSIVDSLQGTHHDYGLVRRQAVRIIETIDGTNYARSSGDLPAKYPSELGMRVGLLSSPNQRGYIDVLSLHVNQVKQTAGKDATLLQHAQNVQNAISDLQDWVQKMRTYAVHILKAADLTDPAIIGVALQLKQAAADSYTGHTIPPNNGPQPVLGSAGAYQAYIECQYMATLNLQKI